MKIALKLFCFFICSISFSQEMEFPKLNTKDSISLSETFKHFILAIENKDVQQVQSYCLNEIDCIDCFSTSDLGTKDEYYVTAKQFSKMIIKKKVYPEVLIALKKRGFNISCRTILDYKPKNVPKDYQKDLAFYEVWIHTFLPNELADGHEGASSNFQFIKVNGKFKLFGLFGIP